MSSLHVHEVNHDPLMIAHQTGDYYFTLTQLKNHFSF